MTKQIKVYDIKWHYNYEDHIDDFAKKDYDRIFNSEPTEIIVDVSDWNIDNLDEQNIEYCLSEYISDESGYFHEGYNWEIININKNLIKKKVI